MDTVTEKKEEIDRILKMVNNSEISSIRHTVTQIINVISDPNSSARDLKNVIEIDPPLSSKLLKLSNSAFYGYPKTISEIQEAIVCIGFEAVKELALNQKVCELFERSDYLDGYSRISLWKHSVAVALCSKLIYRREFRERGENVYAAGLLHDIGIIVLDQFLQPVFIDILRKSRGDKNNLINIETSILGFNHADIGRAIAEDWGFPDELVFALGYHHNPDDVEEEFQKIVSTVFVSDCISQSKYIGYCDAPYKNRTLFQKCLMKLNIKEKAIGYIIEEAEEEIEKMKKSGWF